MSLCTLPSGRQLAYALSATPKPRGFVILANPLCANYTSWDHVVEYLNGQGFRTLRFDQPGHGGSGVPEDPTTTTFDMMADDINDLLQSLGRPRVDAWVGVSMGAAMGVVFVTKYPGKVRKLVVCDTISSSPVNAGVEDAFAARVAAAKENGIQPIVQGTMQRWLGEDWINDNAAEARRIRTLMETTSVEGFEACVSALRSATFDLRPLYPKVGTSVNEALLVVGENDADLPQAMQKMREAIEDSFKQAGKSQPVELKVIPHAGHACYLDALGAFTQAVGSFLLQ